MRGAVAVVLVAALAAGCSGDDDGGGTAAATSTTEAACGPEQREPLDPGSSRHLLPGTPEPAYQTDPPTSGPHVQGQLPTGALREPLSRPVQVAMLEAARVLIQYRDLSDPDRAELESLASPHVVIAPNPGLPAAVVATAWAVKLTCRTVSTEALGAFVARRAGVGAGPGAGHP